MRKLLAMLSIAVMAFAGGSMFASAEHRDDSTAGAGGIYVVAGEDGASLWQESNGHAGLQTTDEVDSNGNVTLAKDSQIA